MIVALSIFDTEYKENQLYILDLSKLEDEGKQLKLKNAIIDALNDAHYKGAFNIYMPPGEFKNAIVSPPCVIDEAVRLFTYHYGDEVKPDKVAINTNNSFQEMEELKQKEKELEATRGGLSDAEFEALKKKLHDEFEKRNQPKPLIADENTDLSNFTRGRPISYEELIPMETGQIIWLTYRKNGDTSKNVGSACKIVEYGTRETGEMYWVLEDASDLFQHTFEIGDEEKDREPTDHAIDYCGGEGEIKLWEAVPTKQVEAEVEQPEAV